MTSICMHVSRVTPGRREDVGHSAVTSATAVPALASSTGDGSFVRRVRGGGRRRAVQEGRFTSIRLDALGRRAAAQARAEGTGARHTGPAHHPPLAGPDEQPTVAGRRGQKGLGPQNLPRRGDHGSGDAGAHRLYTGYRNRAPDPDVTVTCGVVRRRL